MKMIGIVYGTNWLLSWSSWRHWSGFTLTMFLLWCFTQSVKNCLNWKILEPTWSVTLPMSNSGEFSIKFNMIPLIYNSHFAVMSCVKLVCIKFVEHFFFFSNQDNSNQNWLGKVLQLETSSEITAAWYWWLGIIIQLRNFRNGHT